MYWLILSALGAAIGSLARLFPDYCGGLVFVESMPLLFVFKKYKKSFYAYCAAILWAALFHAICGVGIVGIRPLYGPPFFWVEMYLLFVGYASVTAVAIFYFSCRITKLLPQKTGLVFFILFWLFLDWCFFLPFGHLEGNRLFSPLLPIAVSPALLFWSYFLKGEGIIIMIVITNYCFYNSMLLRSNFKNILYCLLIVFFWFSGFCIYRYVSIKEKRLSKIASESATPIDLGFCCGTIDKKFDAGVTFIEWCKRKNNRIKYIFLPEAFLINNIPLLKNSHRAWYDFIHNNLTIIGGLTLKQKSTTHNQFYNVIVYISKEGTEIIHHKKRYLFLTETKSWWSKSDDSISNQRVRKLPDNIPIKLVKKSKKNGEDLLLQKIFICSEFLFLRKKIRCKSIFWFLNDSWSSWVYVSYLIKLFARMRAIEERKDLFYIGYADACIIDKYGLEYKMER